MILTKHLNFYDNMDFYHPSSFKVSQIVENFTKVIYAGMDTWNFSIKEHLFLRT